MSYDSLSSWPNCLTPDCPNKCCRIMNSEYCSPCAARIAGVTLATWGQWVTERRREMFGEEETV